MDTFELITKLVGIHGPSGRENKVARDLYLYPRKCRSIA